MMNIGEFAALTGLSVKALRHYDDRGVLTPAAVDPFSSYRKYSEHQVRTGIILKTLRDACMSVRDAAAAISSPEHSLRAHRETVMAQRQEEDHAFARAASIARTLAQPIAITERTMPAQPYVAVTLPVPEEDASSGPESADRMNDEFNRSGQELWQRLATAGIRPDGPPWLTMRMQDKETIGLMWCQPVPRVLPAEWGGAEVEVGVLSERAELCALWNQDGGDDLPEGVTHPALIGLFDAYADHPTASLSDVREIRQTTTGSSPEDFSVEIAVTLR